MHWQPDGHGSKGNGDIAFLAVRVEGDMVGMPHDAFFGKVVGVMHSFTRYDGSSFESYDEIPVVFY
jgi:hypothetical protein